MGTVFLRSGQHPPPAPRPKRNPGATPRKHARAILDERCRVVQYSVKALRWQFNPDAPTCEHCGHVAQRTPRTVTEDLLAHSFDAVGVVVGEPLLLVQWSSYDGVPARLRKVERGFLSRVYTERGSVGRTWCGDHLAVQVWGWVNGAGFRVWAWGWPTWTWQPERELLLSPLLAGRR